MALPEETTFSHITDILYPNNAIKGFIIKRGMPQPVITKIHDKEVSSLPTPINQIHTIGND